MNIVQNRNLQGANVKVELDLSHYAAKADLKNARGVVDKSGLVKKLI